MLVLIGCVMGCDDRDGLEFHVMHMAHLKGLVMKRPSQCMAMCISNQPYNSANYNALKEIQSDLQNLGCPRNAQFVVDMDSTGLANIRIHTMDPETDVYCNSVIDARKKNPIQRSGSFTLDD